LGTEGVLEDMDDHELGALLDAAIPGAPASDAVLGRIRRRASQRRRRTALAGGALSVAIAAALALGISAVGGSPRSATPVGRTTPSSGGSGPTTMVPVPRCFPGDVTLTINPHSESFNQVTEWAVTARSRAEAPCRLVAPIRARALDSVGRVVVGDATVAPTDPGYVSFLTSDTPALVAQLNWTLPCSDGPVDLEVSGIASVPARLALPRQPCQGSIGQSSFTITAAGPGVAGGPCPFGSLVLAIGRQSVRTADTVRWRVTATSPANLLCRIHSGIEATIETPDGNALRVSGNPARQGEQFQDLFPPGRPQFVGYLSWTNPCSDTPVRLVVRFENGRDGQAARLELPKQACAAGPIETSHFQIDLGIPGTASSPAP
jgi:hypothetical protein